MNAGDSAGGGHQGRSPAPPAVPDRRSTSLTANNQAIPTLVTIATTHATNSNTSITPKRTDSISSYSEIPTSSRSFQQVFTQQQQLQLHSQEEAIVPFLSGSAVVTSQANNHSQHHMQPVSGHNVAGVAALTTVSNRHPTHDRIFVSQIKVPKISYSATSSQPTADVSSQVKRIKIDNVATDNVVIGAVGNLVGSLLPTVPSSGNRNSFRAAAETTPKDTITLKYLIIEKEYLRLKSIKEKHSDHVAELFYLESGSNMMDYPAWKKKPPSTQLIDFCNAYRLDQLENEEAAELTAEAATAKLQQEEAENIATVIGVHSSQPVKQQQTETSTTNAPKSTLPSTGQVALKRKRSLSLTPNVISAATTVTPSTSTLLGQESSLPQGAEIKIPAVGATPVAVSTQLPAAVVQLTQKGGTPLVPHCNANPSPALRRNGNGIDKEVPNLSTIAKESSANSPKSLYSSYLAGGIYPTGIAANESNTTTDVGHVAVGSSNSVQEFSFKAKQEVYVMQRISELQREGLWTEKRLPKQQEPSRTKAHWDYLLEEMVWLAADFAQERKWKKNAAKKCAKMVQKYFQDKANAAQKAEKAHELHLKRVASFISKEIKMFWSNVEKLVEYKHHTKIEEKRKKALDQHLSFIVDQTEKFSQQLAEGMNKSNMDSTIAASAAPSINSSRISSPKREEANISDDEFRPVSSSEDDEETIAKAEEEAANVNEEIVALEKEAKMDLDDFINDLPVGYLKNRDKLVIEDRIFTSASDDTDDAEFEADDVSEDDEKTISQQEAEETELDHKKELDELEADNDLTVEQLMKKYKSKQINNSLNRQRSKMEVDSDDDDDDDDDDTESDAESEVASDNSPIVSDNEMSSSSDAEEDDNKDGLKSLLEYNDTNQDDMIKDAAALAESIQPKGNTLSSTNVVTPVPFLLKHSLREYQHIGLDWLVTMNERKLNGILADEMGLGKTIQTIALLAHLACVKGNWGPHLIVVPSSVMLNWEMEFKKWCPGFKILTYYGTQKERKSKRVGWTKPNAFHVCITSYKLVVQDQQSFRRKKWKYLILDEAQNIKNFKSQRWQLLLNFSTDRRLLLTGTPLQNDLMELWSLMHFLMPYVFSSHREFKEWFSNPMTGMIEGNMEYNESLINRLHKVIRPFLLRRLKKEVEKQMPKKYEHVIMCRLSNRQRYLYDDFMSRAKTKETLQTGNLLSVINILMQLRKVCNHPNMFEVRPTISPFQMDGISYQAPRLVCDMLEYNPFKHIDLQSLNFILCKLEYTLTAYASYKSRLLAPRPKLIEEIDLIPEPPPRCPAGEYRFHVRVRDAQVQRDLSTHSSGQVQAGSSPAMKTENDKLVPIHNVGKASNRIKSLVDRTINPINFSKLHTSTERLSTKPTQSSQAVILGAKAPEATNTIAMLTAASTTTPTPSPTTAKIAKIVQSGKPYLLVTSSRSASGDAAGRLTLVCKPTSSSSQSVAKIAPSSVNSNKNAMVKALAQKVKTTTEETGMKAFAAGEKKVKAEDDNSSELDPLYNMPQLLQKRQKWRSANMKFISKINNRRTEAVPIYGADCREALEKCTAPIDLIQFSSWQTRGYTNCRTAMVRKDNWTLSALLKSYERRCEELLPTFVNFIIYVPSTCVPRQRFYVQNLCSGRVQQQCHIEATITRELSSKLALLHPITSAMLTQFPDPRLIQYDCGKLQRLDLLLRELKSGQHRVLIFTQMTKMLDVLEAFLNYHGHIYLRLDGSTRVEQRQILMERFNGDKRIFCFILSTRSGGIGINLTGADTVIFYDSDWNPTMDAQAQDRCHRIGQTRDVHIYRLVSEKTIEVNILKKANQKRMLSDMAIEGGNFTATFFKSSTIKDLFNTDNQDRYIDTVSCSKTMEVESEKQSLRVFETALAVAEDEQDVQATKTAKAEVAADLAEFDENIPIEDATVDHANNPAATAEMSKADLEVHNLVKQLSPIERYAMRFVEETGASWTAEQLRAAEEELEAQKREWEANRLAALLKEEEMLNKEDTAEDMITYSRKDATNQVWISDNTLEQMPMWCPPTPPQNCDDVYIDYSLSFMYETTTVIQESELPPVYIHRDFKRSRADAGFMLDGSRRPSKIRKEDNYFAPRSLFDRPSPAIAKIRRDLKLQRYRGVFKPNVQIPGIKNQIPQKAATEWEGMTEWAIYEDFAMIYVLANMQGLPCNLMPLSPGHTTNWDLVADVVNRNSKTYRSPKQCRWRYETVVLPREEGKIVESPKKHKKIKSAMKALIKGPIRSLKTAQIYAGDNNISFIKMMRSKFDCIKAAYLKKAPQPKRHFSAPSPMNPKHAEVLQEFGISNYDQPISPLNIALMKASKMREKQRSHLPPPQTPVSTASSQQQNVQQAQQQHQVIATPATHSQTASATQQLQVQQITSLPQQAAAPSAILMQQTAQQQQQQQPTQLQHAGNQSQAIARTSTACHQQGSQLVKAIVTPQSGLITAGQIQQQLAQQSTAASQQLQLQPSPNLVAAPSSVSVVLSTPLQSISSNVHHQMGANVTSTTQIVSIAQSSTSQMDSIVQTIPSQSIPQVVSVSQLATVGTVLTTSSNMPHATNTTVATLNTSALRAQRIVATTSAALQDVVLQQRPSNQSPTIVSMAALGPNVTPTQFQAAQLRLASMPGSTQQVVAKGIPLSSLQQNAKISAASGNQPAHIQLYRQRQQLKVLQAGQAGGQTVLQTASGQTALVNSAGTLIQGAIGPATVQVQQGQKIAVATVSTGNAANASPGIVTSVATVQVAQNQGRAQFIKQVAAKQAAIARQVPESEMLLVKRQVLGSHPKGQVLQQAQLLTAATSGNVQITQQQQQQQQNAVLAAGASLQQQHQQQVSQQIATLVKTSSGTVSNASSAQTIAIGSGQQQATVNMALSHLKPGGQIKVTMANQSQMRQLQLQHQHLAITQPRKISKMTQITAAQAQLSVGGCQQQVSVSGHQVQSVGSGSTLQKTVAGGSGLQTQLVHIQNPKALPGSVTVQQIQQVMRQGQQNTLAATGLVLGKTSVGRVIPVSVASQPNQRQTIQVVTAASAQAIAAGGLRAHVATGPNISGAIKVTASGQGQNHGQTQQALITALQQQAAAQQSHRQNASPVRLQASVTGNLVTVMQQQPQQSCTAASAPCSIAASGSGSTQADAVTITQASSPSASSQLASQVANPQHVRTLVKKKIMQIRNEKE